MAGMLPGVESARRRRVRGSSGWCDPSSITGSGFGSARFRLSHDTHFTPTSFFQRSVVNLNLSDEDGKLGGAAREAKERLDGRLRGHLKQEIRRQHSKERSSRVGRRSKATTPMVVMEDLQIAVFRSKRNGLNWGKRLLRWKSSEEDECAICLDEFMGSEKIAVLHCAHRFHSDCLLPWLEGNAHCPCCRATVFGSS